MIKLTSKTSSNWNRELPVDCPCGNPIKIEVRNAAPGSTITCSRCGATIELTGDDMRKAQQTIDDVRRIFEKIGR